MMKWWHIIGFKLMNWLKQLPTLVFSTHKTGVIMSMSGWVRSGAFTVYHRHHVSHQQPQLPWGFESIPMSWTHGIRCYMSTLLSPCYTCYPNRLLGALGEDFAWSSFNFFPLPWPFSFSVFLYALPLLCHHVTGVSSLLQQISYVGRLCWCSSIKADCNLCVLRSDSLTLMKRSLGSTLCFCNR